MNTDSRILPQRGQNRREYLLGLVEGSGPVRPGPRGGWRPVGTRGSARCAFSCRRFLGHDKPAGHSGYSLEGERAQQDCFVLFLTREIFLPTF